MLVGGGSFYKTNEILSVIFRLAFKIVNCKDTEQIKMMKT